MNPTEDLLSQLRDIQLPSDPSWWPPAPGWWLVALSVVGLSYIIFSKIAKWRRLTAPSRKFVSAIRKLPTHDPARSQQNLNAISRLTRQYAITRFGRNRVAGLTGSKWLVFLDQSSKSKSFSHGPGTVLASGPYKQPAKYDLDGLKRILEAWARETRNISGQGDLR